MCRRCLYHINNRNKSKLTVLILFIITLAITSLESKFSWAICVSVTMIGLLLNVKSLSASPYSAANSSCTAFGVGCTCITAANAQAWNKHDGQLCYPENSINFHVVCSHLLLLNNKIIDFWAIFVKLPLNHELRHRNWATLIAVYLHREIFLIFSSDRDGDCSLGAFPVTISKIFEITATQTAERINSSGLLSRSTICLAFTSFKPPGNPVCHLYSLESIFAPVNTN